MLAYEMLDRTNRPLIYVNRTKLYVVYRLLIALSSVFMTEIANFANSGKNNLMFVERGNSPQATPQIDALVSPRDPLFSLSLLFSLEWGREASRI